MTPSQTRGVAAAWLACALLPLAGPRDALAQTIPLTVAENAGVTRTSEPVTSGVPITPAQTGASWALFDGAREIPLQTTVLPGRTVPWLLLDFQTSLAAGQVKSLTLRQQPPLASAAQPVTVVETSLQITVTTGPLRTQIGKTDFNLLDAVWLDRNGDGSFASSEQVVGPPASSNLTVRDAGTGATFSGRGQPAAIVWEYKGPMRATLRVDGAYTNGTTKLLDYTTRITWWAGQTGVRIEHLIRNSLAARERYVKLSSAVLRAGPAATAARVDRSGAIVWANVGSSGAALGLIPPTVVLSDLYSPYASPPVWRHNVTMDVDGNGGLVIGDLSYHGATWQLDFAENLSAGEAARRARVAGDPLMALAGEDYYADRNAFGLVHTSSYADEKNAYRRWGWTWPTPGDPWSQEHDLPRVPDLYPSWSVLDAANDPESDDLSDNVEMYLRVQIPAFLDRLRGWARYSKWEWAFRTDGFEYAGAWGDFFDGPGTVPRSPALAPALTANDSAWIDHDIKHGKADESHMWNGGLLDVYYLTGDRDALAAAIDAAEQVKRYFAWQSLPTQYVGGNARFPGRAMIVLTRTWEATGDPQWRDAADHLLTLFLQSPNYDPRGFYYKPTQEWGPVIGGQFAAGAKQVVPLHMTSVVEGLYRYYLSTGSAAVRTQLLQIADFARDHGVDPATGYGGDIVVVDSPQPGGVLHLSYSQFQNQPPIYPYTVAGSTNCMINALVIGYRLTGDARYLQRAKFCWNQGSKRWFDDPYDKRMATDTQVGRFANSLQGWGSPALLFPEGGDWTRMNLLFYEAVRADSLPPNRVLDLRREP